MTTGCTGAAFRADAANSKATAHAIQTGIFRFLFFPFLFNISSLSNAALGRCFIWFLVHFRNRAAETGPAFRVGSGGGTPLPVRA
jgi:hypothetical protein